MCWSCGRSLPVQARVGSPSSLQLSTGAVPSRERTRGVLSERPAPDEPAPEASERDVLTRYFAAPQPVVKEGAERSPERPIYARPRVWWDQQVRWSSETGLGRRSPQGPPPPPAPSPGPPLPPPPRRSPEPIRIVTAPPTTPVESAERTRGPAEPLGIVIAPPTTPAEWAARTRGSADALEAMEPTATRAARKLGRLWIATLAVVVMFVAIGIIALVPPPVPEPDPNPLRSERSSGAAPGQPAEAGSDAEADDSSSTEATAPDPSGNAPGASQGAAEPATRILERINEARAEAGHGALVVDADLETVADRHVSGMIERGRLAHTPTDVLGRRVTNWRVLAESIGVGPSVTSLFDALMDSNADRRNLLDPTFHHVGVGATRSGDRLWLTVLFSDSRDPGTILD